MTAHNGLSYQTIIEEIYTHIQEEETVNTINVQQNATIAGKTTGHFVDIYWEFTDGDLRYKTVIYTRDWDKTAGNLELFRFLSLIRDIPGHTTGVFFTQPLYDKDTKAFAADAGIMLYEVREPVAGQAEPVVCNPRINVDLAWAKQEKERVGLGDQLIQTSGDPKYLYIYDENGNCLDSVQGILNTYIQKHKDDTSVQTLPVMHVFGGPVFLQTDNDLFPMVKLQSIAFDLEFVSEPLFDGRETVKYILEKTLSYYDRR
jgi:hypothetical protein